MNEHVRRDRGPVKGEDGRISIEGFIALPPSLETGACDRPPCVLFIHHLCHLPAADAGIRPAWVALSSGVIDMTRHLRLLPLVLLGASVLTLAAPAGKFEATRIFIEYNSTDHDLGFHVFLDAEEWKSIRIVNPAGTTIFDVAGKGPYGNLGLSELFFEGSEPNLDDFPLDDL